MIHRKVLFFSRSVLFEHSVVARKGAELSFAEKMFVEITRPLNLDVLCTKDGHVFDKRLDEFAAVVSYACGSGDDMLKPQAKDGSAPMSPQGLQRLRKAVLEGMPFVAIHPGFWMLAEAVGCGYVGHGTQQMGTMRVVSLTFPGVERLAPAFSMMEEWFSLRDFAQDIHVILVQETRGMNIAQPVDKKCYDRPPYPATWARMHGKGRVFFTSLGHREDVWASAVFRDILIGGLRWALGDVHVELTPNLHQVAPQANQVNQ